MQNENAEPKSSLRKAKTGAGPGRVQATVDVINAGSRRHRAGKV